MQNSLSYFPPGNRFHPTDEELIRYYLYKIVNGGLSSKDATVIKDYNLYGEEEPWEIFNKFEGDKSGDNGLYFYTKLSKKTPNSTKKMSRTVGTNGGTWHGDGSNDIKSRQSSEEIVIGRKKRFLYKNNRQSDQHGCWIMLEYGSESISDSTVISQLKKSKYGFSRKRKLMDSEGIIEVSPDDEIINSEPTTSQAHQEPQQIIQNQNMWPMVGIVSIEDDGGPLSSTEYPFHTFQNMGYEAPAIINIEPTLQVEPNQINFIEEPTLINEQQMEHASFNDNRVKEIISVEDYELVDQSEALLDVDNAEVPAVIAMPTMEAGLMESFKNEANWFDNLQALLKEDGYQDDWIDLGSIW